MNRTNPQPGLRGPRLTECITAGAVALALTACGGGGGSSAPPPTPTPTVAALDDQYTVTAGAVASLDVSSNDSTTGGTPVLSVVTAPLHGQVVVQGTRLQYTADAAYIGNDQLTYRVDVGTTSANATVKLTVEGEFELSGSVPGINSPTEVTAQIDDRQVKVNADASGAYKLSFKTAKPGAFLTLTARESGARAAFVYTGLVGDAASLAAAAPSLRVTEAQWPALRLDLLNTARLGLLAQRGEKPTSTTALRAALARQDPADLLDVATLLRHVRDDGVALPAGITTLAELAASKSALGVVGQQWRNQGDGIENLAQVEKTLNAAAATTPIPVSTQGTRLVSAYAKPNSANVPDGSMLDLRPDGSATGFVWTFSTNTAIQARWAVSDNTLTVTLASPLPLDGTYRVLSQQYRLLRGFDGKPGRQWMTRWQTDCQLTPRPPAYACAFEGLTPWVPVIGFDVDRDRQPFLLEDFAAGTRWAGLPDPSFTAGFGVIKDYVLDGTPTLPGMTGQILDGQWLLMGAPTGFRYTRLGAGPEDGMEHWLVEFQRGGVTERAKLLLVAKGTTVAPLDTGAAARKWATGSQAANGSSDVTGLRFSLFPQVLHRDGRLTYDLGSGEVDRGDRWTLSSDGRTLYARTAAGQSYGLFSLVRPVSGGYLAMSESGGLVRMRDLGAAD